MSLSDPGGHRLRSGMILLTLALVASTITGASSRAADWSTSSDADLAREGQRLQRQFSAGLDSLRGRSIRFEAAVAAAPATSFETSAAAFAFLTRHIGDEPALLGVPLGLQLLRDGEALAWAGFSLPAGGVAPEPGEGPRVSLREFGIFHFLSCHGRLAGPGGGPALEWILDLPLSHRMPGGEGGLKVLLETATDFELRLLPAEFGPVAPSPASGPEVLTWQEGALPDARSKQGKKRSWLLEASGVRLLELQLVGLPELEFRRRVETKKRRLLGGGLLLIVLAAGLILRALLRRSRPTGLPLAARAPFIIIWVLLLRWILRWAGLPASLLADSFWEARSFALALPGGVFDSPGEFLISALAALLVLVLLLRPYLHPETDVDETEAGKPEPRAGAHPLRMLLALFAPLLAVVSASGFAALVLANSAPALLFDTGLLAGDALGFNSALFLACAFLVSLFLVPAHFAWRRLPDRRISRLAAALPLLLLAQLLAGFAAVLALLLLLPVAWGFRRAAARFTGLLFHVVFVIMAVTVMIEGSRDSVRERAMTEQAAFRASEETRSLSYWQPILAEQVLQELAMDPSIRRQLAVPAGADAWLAMTAWQQSGLTALGEQGCLEIYDARGRLRSRHQHGLDLPEPLGHSNSRPGRPDRSFVVETVLSAVGADSLRLVTGEIALVEGGTQALGFLVLRLLDARERTQAAPPDPAPARGLLQHLLDGSQRLFLHLMILAALLLVDLLFSRLRLVRRYLPPLIGPHGLGFQHKLLGAFLLVALLPVVLTGLIAGRQIQEQQDEASRRTSLERAQSARRSLENRVRQDARGLAGSEYVRNFLVPDFPPTVRDIGSLENNRIMIFNAGGELLLDESLRNWSPAQVDSFLSVLPPGRVVYEREEQRVYAGLLLPMEIWHQDARLAFSVYYRLRLDEVLLDGLQEVVGGELNLHGGGSLLHAGRSELFGLGYLPPMLDPVTAASVALGGAAHHQRVDRVGRLRFGRSTVPLADALGRPVALLTSLEVAGQAGAWAALGGGGSLVFGMIALLVLLALGLGAFLAGRVFLPIRRLLLGTRRLSAGEFDFRLPDAGRDEIGELVGGFNSMAEGLAATRHALEERRRFLESVLENVASGVLAFDPDGRLRSANSAARRLLDLDGIQAEGASLDALADQDSEPARDLFRHLIAHPDGLRGAACELRVAGEEGLRRFRLADADTGGGRVVLFEDVTELIRSQKLAAWSEMARQVAHEIKNPLTPIKLSAQHIDRAWRDRKENFDDILGEGLGSITEQVEILRGIAQEFSRFGRPRELATEPLDLGALLRELLAPYRGESLTLSWTGPESMLVMADREALRKVLLNLVENARQAMEGGGRLDLSLSEGGGRAELALRDHGPGIPVEALDRLFEPYFSTKTSGAGLGLAISAQLVEEMGGQLALENHPEGGAVARLDLECVAVRE